MPLVPDNPNNRSIASILLREGGVIAYPTDTVYGLGASVFNYSSVSTMFVIKARERHQAVPVLIASESQLSEIAIDISDDAYRLAKAFWPGKLTLIMKSHPDLPSLVTGGGDTVGVRLPDHPCPQSLIQALGAPITGTSANRHNGAEPTTANEVQKQLGNRLSLILDGGPSPSNLPSTIIDTTSSTPKVVRTGVLSIEQIKDICDVYEPRENEGT
ncbi:MAG: threonylcarbamoyl-AMP synthase [SAR202 cluster bacterium]|nr:threonylcarbamoyl-AMP synthase [SAR202 cluster bacterium]|tara:strand:- start:20803 stop:21447 length:645 start_codon:yes stop_codon:yes gene_type:complete